MLAIVWENRNYNVCGNENWYDFYGKQLGNVYKNHYNEWHSCYNTFTLKNYPEEAAEIAQRFL